MVMREHHTFAQAYRNCITSLWLGFSYTPAQIYLCQKHTAIATKLAQAWKGPFHKLLSFLFHIPNRFGSERVTRGAVMCRWAPECRRYEDTNVSVIWFVKLRLYTCWWCVRVSWTLHVHSAIASAYFDPEWNRCQSQVWLLIFWSDLRIARWKKGF